MITLFQEEHAKRLVDSFKSVTGKDLIERDPNISIGQQLFEAPFVVVSHNGGVDPILNFGNRTALDLWEMQWVDFVATPSRKTAEPEYREDRAAMLEQAKKIGFIDDYRGIRVSSSGKRFLIEKAIIWTVPIFENSRDGKLQNRGISRPKENTEPGQAATFTHWRYI